MDFARHAVAAALPVHDRDGRVAPVAPRAKREQQGGGVGAARGGDGALVGYRVAHGTLDGGHLGAGPLEAGLGAVVLELVAPHVPVGALHGEKNPKLLARGHEVERVSHPRAGDRGGRGGPPRAQALRGHGAPASAARAARRALMLR